MISFSKNVTKNTCIIISTGSILNNIGRLKLNKGYPDNCGNDIVLSILSCFACNDDFLGDSTGCVPGPLRLSSCVSATFHTDKSIPYLSGLGKKEMML